jgi:amino acid adenylation domain-containing protein
MSPSLEGFLPSPQQRHLWALRQAGGGPYTTAAVVRIDGSLDMNRLGSALRRVAARHEIFHTTFVTLPGMVFPIQVLDPGALPQIEVLDLGSAGEEERGAAVAGLVARLSAEVGEVSRGPLLRAALARAGEGSCDFVLALPALCADEATLALLLRRVFAAYDALDAAAGSEGDGEPLQYAELAAWQNELLESGEGAAERALLHKPELWARRQAALPPAWRPRPVPSAAFAPRCLPFRSGPALADAVAALAESSGSAEDAVLLAAWLTLLSRLAGERDLVVGVAFDGRKFEDLKDAVGPLTRHLPLHAHLPPEGRWCDLLPEVAEGLRSLGEWQDRFSLEQLAAGTGDEKAGAPFFPVCFAWEGEIAEPAARGLALRVTRRQASFDRFDLALVCRREGPEIALSIRFDAGALRGKDLMAFPGRFRALLAAAIARPEARIAELPMLAEAERQLCLVERNDTRRDSTLGGTLPALFEARAALHPDRLAVEAEEGTLTYGELDRRANRLAHYLRRLGVRAEARVAVCLDRSLGLLVALLGVLKAGGAYVPLDPTYPPERLAYLLASSGARALLTDSRLAETFSWDGATVRLDRDADAIAAGSPASPEPPDAGPGPEVLAYVIYTSGSTGRPKGVMIPHGAICNRLRWMQEELPLIAGDRVLQKTPASFDASVWELFCPLLAGACLALARPGGHQDAEYLVRAVASLGVTVLQLVPSALRMVLEVPELDRCITLKRLFCGGEALPTELRDRFFARLPAELVNLYGPTEVSIDVTFHRCRRGGPVAAEGPFVPIGSPLANLRVYLLDNAAEPGVPGATGELYAAGSGLARGYLGRPELTAERFVPDPWSTEPGGRLYRTGDLARFRPDGAIEFLGRADQQVKIRGFRIEPGEIEARLTADPEVRAAAVAAREVAPGDVRLFAWIVPRRPGGGAAAAQALRDRLRASLPEPMVPSAFVFLAELPLLPNGKLDRASLAAPGPDGGEGGAGAESTARPATPVEGLLAALWSDVLGRGEVGLHDNVFDLGAHSLLVTQVVSRLRETFGVSLPLRALFDEPTVAGLARRIGEARRDGQRMPPPLEPVSRGGLLPVSFAQQRLWFLDQLDPGSSAYSTPLAFRLAGPLRVGLLAAAFDRLVERHEALRTTFPVRDGQPVQQIGLAYRVELPVLDLAALPEAARVREMERLTAPSSQPPFDLTRGPLLRVALLRLALDEHALVVTLHHIVSDAWSTWVAVRDLAAIYGALAVGRRPELPVLGLQYADFAVWERGWLQGEVLEGEIAYWRQRLANLPPALDLPTDFPRPPRASFAGDLRVRWLPSELQSELRALSRRERSSLYMTLLAAWYVLLRHLTGRDDLVVGTSVAARDRLELEGMVGFFVNMLILRTELAGDPTFTEVLRRVRETALEGFLHQAVPFDRLVEELQAGRDRSRDPLFQVAFTFENAPGRIARFENLRLEPQEMKFDTAVFDLALLMEETDRGLWSGIRYRTALFRPATVEGWLAQLAKLLAEVAADPSLRVSQLLDLLAADERRLRKEREETLARASLHKLTTRTRTATLSQG